MKSLQYVHINGINIQIQVIRERRRSVRASFTSKGVNLRLPSSISDEELPTHLEWCKNWIKKVTAKNPTIAERYQEKEYTQDSIIPIYDTEYKLDFKLHSKKSYITGRIEDQTIYIRTPVIPLEREYSIKMVVHLLNKHYLSKIKERVDYINDLTIRKPYKKLQLKHLKTQWGNCGTNGTIKLSTRLLLLPEKIQNAIILHELTHLVHMHHGPQFYNLLYKYMPDYDRRDVWLKENEGRMKF